MYRLIVESLLGLRLEAGYLRFAPVLPAEWTVYTMDYRHGDTLYRITVHQVDSNIPATLTLDGVAQADGCMAQRGDGVEHRVEIHWPRID